MVRVRFRNTSEWRAERWLRECCGVGADIRVDCDDLHKIVSLNGTKWDAGINGSTFTDKAYRAWQEILAAGEIDVIYGTDEFMDVSVNGERLHYEKLKWASFAVLHEHECLLKRLLRLLELYTADRPEYERWIDVELAHLIAVRARTPDPTDFERGLYRQLIDALMQKRVNLQCFT